MGGVIASASSPHPPAFRVVRACAVLVTVVGLGVALAGCGGSSGKHATTSASASNGTPVGSAAAYHTPPSRAKVLRDWDEEGRLIAIGQGATYFSTPCVAYNSGRSCVVTESGGTTFMEYIVPSGVDRYHEWTVNTATDETVGNLVLSGERIVNSFEKVIGSASGTTGTTAHSGGAAPIVYMPSYGGPSSEKPAPSTFVLGNTTRRGFTWAGWGSSTAVGNGQVESNDCTPSCAAGRVTWVPEKDVLTQIVSCHGRRFYGVLRIGSSLPPYRLQESTCTY
jgi:hypothetical protein